MDKHSHTVRTHSCFCRDSDQLSEDEDEAGSCFSDDGSDFNNNKLEDTR